VRVHESYRPTQAKWRVARQRLVAGLFDSRSDGVVHRETSPSNTGRSATDQRGRYGRNINSGREVWNRSRRRICGHLRREAANYRDPLGRRCSYDRVFRTSCNHIETHAGWLPVGGTTATTSHTATARPFCTDSSRTSVPAMMRVSPGALTTPNRRALRSVPCS
jgi:hypothetical protein